MKLFQKILASLFLAALLFALSGKTIHVLFEHQEEQLCTENSTHFHEKEHTCFICDFEFQVADDFKYSDPEFRINTIVKEEVSNAIFFVFYETHFSFTSRGPPAA
jgi:hypothetical protein